MLPGNILSTQAVFSGFSEVTRSARELLTDYEMGGASLNDGTQGLLVKQWVAQCFKENHPTIADQFRWYVRVSAPGSPWTDLISSDIEITEIALAFDNNMNPFIAYVEGGVAKFRWYNISINNYTTTILPAGSKTPRCCTDDKRPSQTAISDICLAYIQNGNLYILYQRENYAIANLLKPGVGPDAALVAVGINKVLRMQVWFRGFSGPSNSSIRKLVRPWLGDVVSDFCLDAGLKKTQINVDELYEEVDTVAGIKVDIDEGLDTPIDWLRDMFFFDKAEHNRVLHFPKRGREIVARIPYTDLVAGNPQALKKKIVDEKKLPRVVNVNHIDPNGGYAKNKQAAQRRSNVVNALGKNTIDAQVVLTADQAAAVALTKLKVFWNEQISYEFSTTIKYTELTPGDVVEVEDSDGTWHRMRLEERNEDSGRLEWDGKQDAGARTYGKQATGNATAPPTSTTPGLAGETVIEILNIGVQRDQNDELGVYIAAAGANSGWTGYTMYISTDGGFTFNFGYEASTPATIGETLTDLPDILSYEHQADLSVDVETNFPLASITYDQLLRNQNRFVIGDEEAQFLTATLLGVVLGKYRYRLSGLIRGRYNSAIEFWPLGTRFVLIDEAVVFVQAQQWMIGVDIEYKPVSFNTNEDETNSTSYLYDDPVNQIEWPVTTVTANRDAGSNDVTVTWIPRARLGLDSAPYHSKYYVGSRVKFSNGHTVDIPKGTESVVYPAAPGGITVQVCSINQITGEGPYSTTLAT
jgi:hypothetical protein